MKRRSYISLKTKLAAALRCMVVEENGKLVPALSYSDAKGMTNDQVISLFQFDHGIHHSISADDSHWNLTPRFISEHRAKTNALDKPAIAKADRIADKHDEFRRKILAKSGQEPGQKTGQNNDAKPLRRSWPTGRKFQSRPFPKRPKPKSTKEKSSDEPTRD